MENTMACKIGGGLTPTSMSLLQIEESTLTCSLIDDMFCEFLEVLFLLENNSFYPTGSMV